MATMSTTASTSSSGASSVGPKASKVVAKSGFVIPKNKLSGSLVPVSRGGKKAGGPGLASEDSCEPEPRKSRWGPDLCLDTAVRKGRAIAYQTRVNQITEQLQHRTLVVEGNDETSDLDKQSRLGSSIFKLLELERRETIGEILRLNSSFKPPIGYKPLLKEARVCIPVKEQKSQQLLELIFGPKNGTLKRLEQETGAKLQVFGTKSESSETVEITHIDFSASDVTYEELSFSIAAETFDKVDAAVSLIELLVISLMDNLTKDEQCMKMSKSNLSPHTSDQAPDQIPNPDQLSKQISWSQLVASHGSQTSSSTIPQNPPPLFGSLPPQSSFQQPRNLFSSLTSVSAEPGVSPYPLLNSKPGLVDFPSNPRPPFPTLQQAPNKQGLMPDQSFAPTGSSTQWPNATSFQGPSPMQITTPAAHLDLSHGSRHAPMHGLPTFKASLMVMPPGPMNMGVSHTGPAAYAPRFATGSPLSLGPSPRPMPMLNPSAKHDSGSSFRPPMAGDFTFKMQPPPVGNLARFPVFNNQLPTWNPRAPPSIPSGPFGAGGMMPTHLSNSHIVGNPTTRFPLRFPPISSSMEHVNVQMQPRTFSHGLPPRNQWLPHRGPVLGNSVSNLVRSNEQLDNASKSAAPPGSGAQQVYDPFSPTSVENGTKSENE